MNLKHWKLGLIAALFSGSLYAAPVEVVSSFSILGDVAKQVGGERVNVSNLVGPDQDAHAYNLTSRDMQRIRNAKLVLVNGLGFEQAAVMRGIRQSGVPFAEATKNIQPMTTTMMITTMTTTATVMTTATIITANSTRTCGTTRC